MPTDGKVAFAGEVVETLPAGTMGGAWVSLRLPERLAGQPRGTADTAVHVHPPELPTPVPSNPLDQNRLQCQESKELFQCYL